MKLLPLFLITPLLLLMTPASRAQSPATPPRESGSALDKALLFAATTTQHGADHFVWLVWLPTDPLFPATHTVALYRKNGGPASPATYTRVSVIEPSADARLLASMLPVAQRLGQDMDSLTALLDDFLGAADASVTVPQKISSLVARAHGDADLSERLQAMGRQHPALAMAAGVAHADKIPASGMVTYELRLHDSTGGADLAVLGRVSVDTSTPLLLPAPGRPFVVEDASQKGDLNVALRWATPDALLDLSPLHFGYDVFRMPLAAAQAHGWMTTPPATAADLVSEPSAVRVNALPVLPDKSLTSAQANDASDTETVFLLDDNDRFRAGAGFADGDELAYFVVARDLLGRGGLCSQGRSTVARDRMPTTPPRQVRVRNHVTYAGGTGRDQRFVIEWEPPPLEGAETVAAYYVYRWRTPAEIPGLAKQTHPATGRPHKNLIAIVPGSQNVFIDDGSTAPPPWADVTTTAPDPAVNAGETWFYTIRALDGSVAGNLSANSGPAWGVLRDRAGPAGVDGGLSVRCMDPALEFVSLTQVDRGTLTDDLYHLRFQCVSDDARGMDWAEFAIAGANETELTVVGRASFRRTGTGQSAAMWRYLFEGQQVGKVACRAGTRGGLVTDWVIHNPVAGITQQVDKYVRALWAVSLNAVLKPVTGPGARHESLDSLTGTVTGPEGSFVPPSDAKEFKIYRRVDDGPQSLIFSGSIAASPVLWTDPNPVAGNATVCYFLQLFDEHGNPGPLTPQGECVTFGSPDWLPRPLLRPITAPPFGAGAEMKVSWFCGTPGVERFEVWVARQSGAAALPTGSGLSGDLAETHPNRVLDVEGVEGLDFSVFQTTRVRHLSAGGTPQFEFTLPASFSDTFTVMVRAVGVGGFGERFAGEFSNVETFQMSLRKRGGTPQVPWPDRPLPPVADFHPGITVLHADLGILSPWKGNMVRIGEISSSDPQFTVGIDVPETGNEARVRVWSIPEQRDVEDWLYKNDALVTLEPLEARPGVVLPVVLYRVQVANARFPVVPGDVVQVSPMMERIAQYDSISGTRLVTDPFISVLTRAQSGLAAAVSGSTHDILLMDRQPVLKGARYRYFLVRFGPDKEIERVIDAGTADVPL